MTHRGELDRVQPNDVRDALRPNGAKPPRENISIGIARESLLPEQLGLSIGLMQPTPGILLGQYFRQALLEKHADRHMLR